MRKPVDEKMHNLSFANMDVEKPGASPHRVGIHEWLESKLRLLIHEKLIRKTSLDSSGVM